MKKVLICVLVVIIGIMMVGCSSQNYKEAMELYEKGEYEEAQAIFTELGDYENSAEMVNDCVYSSAIKYFEAGEFDLALPLFESVGSDYKEAYKYMAAIPLLKEYAGTTWKYDDGYEKDARGNTIYPTITVKISAPYRIGYSTIFRDADWSVFADIEIDAEIIKTGGGVTNLHFNYEELIPHDEKDGKNELYDIRAVYRNDEYRNTFTNLRYAPYSEITLYGNSGSLVLYEVPYSMDWNTSYADYGRLYRLVKQN